MNDKPRNIKNLELEAARASSRIGLIGSIVITSILFIFYYSIFMNNKIKELTTKDRLTRLIAFNQKQSWWTQEQIDATANAIDYAAHKTKLSKYIILAIIQHESEFQPFAFPKKPNRDGSVDCGLGQINTKKYHCSFDPVISVSYMTEILTDCQRRFDGNNVIRCYNWWGKDYVATVLSKLFIVRFA